MAVTDTYSPEQLVALYELGRMYYEMGYLTPAERIFNGLAAIDEHSTPARLGLGLLKLERGMHAEAASHFRSLLQSDQYALQAKIGLCFSFLRAGEQTRARSVLTEIVKTSSVLQQQDPEIISLFNALRLLFEPQGATE